MAKLVFSTQYTDTELQYCERIIQRHCFTSENCSIWTDSKDRDGYGMIQFQFRGKQVKVRVNRLIFYFQSGCSDMKKLHVSHLCHNRICITPEHLSLEPQSTNNKRKTCKLDGECIGHYGYKSCIL